MIEKIYNSIGSRLLSKQTGLKISKLKAIFKNGIPKNAVSMDIVEIETDFGTGKKIISSYRTKNGNLIKRITEDKNRRTIVVSEYKEDLSLGDKVKETVRKKFSAGEETQNIREKISVKIQNNTNIINRIKLDITNYSDGKTFEKQIYEQFTKKNKDRKYIETFALKDENGKFISKNIYANAGNVEELTSDNYLFIRNYDIKNFIKEVFLIAKKTQGIEDKKINLKFFNFPGIKGVAFLNCIAVNSKLNPKKSNLVETINHEVRHQYQRVLRQKLGFINFVLGKKTKNSNLTKKEIYLARRYHIARIIYDSNSVYRQQYYDNFLEVDARKYGTIALKDYEKSTEYLQALFPNAVKTFFD